MLLLDMTNGEPTPHGDPETPAREAMGKILKEEGVAEVVLPALGQGFDL